MAVHATLGAGFGTGGEFYDRNLSGARVAASLRHSKPGNVGVLGEVAIDALSLTSGHLSVCQATLPIAIEPARHASRSPPICTCRKPMPRTMLNRNEPRRTTLTVGLRARRVQTNCDAFTTRSNIRIVRSAPCEDDYAIG